ncbi:MAG: tetratricopeptide repeat protein [Deltaproteobacteria bacterium]|nr:tetratricopeptide repeat protein [Deltaproteobacteria bacterium]
MKNSSLNPAPALFRFACAALLAFGLSSCESEIIRHQEEQIRLQQEEIVRQQKGIQELITAGRQEEQKRRDCNRAFRDYFEKAQAEKDVAQAVALYREGLKVCPDDDVAHYELGKVLQELRRTEEAKAEFEAAVKINPDFNDARRQLEALK